MANLRGGSEHGEEWHRAGMRERKQNVFDDFAAAGEHLVAEGWTTHGQLAVMGGSNGGLLVGATLTQRPDLAAAVVCSAPLLDMVRYELFGLGRTWNDEYGTADDPTELGWLLGYSPYHAVREGTAYPAVLFTTFESDTRVHPLHGRKLAAALQHATSPRRPSCCGGRSSVGHGARAVSRTVGLAADQLAFLAAHTGLHSEVHAGGRHADTAAGQDPSGADIGTDLADSDVMSGSQSVLAGSAPAVPARRRRRGPRAPALRRRAPWPHRAGRRRSARSSPSASSGRCSARSCCRRPATSSPAWR